MGPRLQQQINLETKVETVDICCLKMALHMGRHSCGVAVKEGNLSHHFMSVS